MKTEVLTLDGSPDDLAKIRHAAKLLQAGALVAFPTETVYGLGADSRNAEALTRLTQVKGRDERKPFALLVPSLRQAEEAAGRFSRVALKLTRLYWPGPLTVVVPRRGGGSVGLRLPEHPITRALLAQGGFPLATPSANRSGNREPQTAQQVLEDFDGQIPLILDGGPTRQGRPSTVVHLDPSGALKILREGIIPTAEIQEAARPSILFICTGNTCRSPMAEGFCRQALQNLEPRKSTELAFCVSSAGTSATEGQRADPLSLAVMREVGVDLSAHRTRSLNPALLDGADWIFTMTWAHRESILRVMPACRDRIRLLSTLGEDIPDPATQPIERYRLVRDRIAHDLRDVLRAVHGVAE